MTKHLTKRQQAVTALAHALQAIRLPISLKNQVLFAAADSKTTDKLIQESIDTYEHWIGFQPDDPAQKRWVWRHLFKLCT